MRFVLVLACALGLTGCGSIAGWIGLGRGRFGVGGVGELPPPPFAGVRLDLGLIATGTPILVLALMDLPATLVLDVASLPFTAPGPLLRWLARPRAPAPPAAAPQPPRLPPPPTALHPGAPLAWGLRAGATEHLRAELRAGRTYALTVRASRSVVRDVSVANGGAVSWVWREGDAWRHPTTGRLAPARDETLVVIVRAADDAPDGAVVEVLLEELE